MPTIDFPMNIIGVLKEKFQDTLPDYSDAVVARPLRPNDPANALGIFPVDWNPDPNSFEISGLGPTLSTYLIRIQLLVKHTDEEEGRAVYAVDAKKLRSILYRDADLRLRLSQLSQQSLGSIERVQRWGVRNQRYLNNEIRGTFMFLATTEFWVETEQV